MTLAIRSHCLFIVCPSLIMYSHLYKVCFGQLFLFSGVSNRDPLHIYCVPKFDYVFSFVKGLF
jgi:hypothetical protein